MNQCVTEKWLRCGVCNSYMGSGESYRNHFLKKHGQIKVGSSGKLLYHSPWKTKEVHFKNIPEPHSSIILTPCQVKVSKISVRKRSLEVSDSGTRSNASDKKQLGLKPASDKMQTFSISGPVKKVLNGSKFPCEICSASFTNMCQLRRHISARHTMERPFKCHECNRRFPRSDQLKSHLRVHSDTTYHNCTQCDGKFRYLSSLNSHISRKHTPDEERKKYPCHLCNAQFLSHNRLATHQERAHNIKKPKKYKCHLCEKSLSSSSGLQNHILMHTNEKPYRCKICDKRYCQNSNLTTHMAQAHRDGPAPRPYACKKCDKTYITKSALKYHVTVHDEVAAFSCLICNNKYKRSVNLKSHLLRHVEERPYKCDRDQCGKSFKHSCTLKLHIKLHLGDKPHSCNVCGKSYVQAVNLRHHIKTKHSSQTEIKKK